MHKKINAKNINVINAWLMEMLKKKSHIVNVIA